MEKEMSGSLSGWAKMPALRLPAGARVKYETEGDEIRWDCPYIYLFEASVPRGYSTTPFGAVR